ncbi:MAG: spore coat protein U domain-containing protein [Bacteriovoracaceae bacterium]
MHLILVFFALIILQSWAKDDCGYQINISNATVMLIDSDQTITQEFTVSRSKPSSGNNCTTYRMFFSKGQANSYQRKAYSHAGDIVNYNLYKFINLSGLLKDFGDSQNSNEFVEGIAPANNTVYTNRFYMSVPSISAQNFPGSGAYNDSVQVRLYSFNPSNHKYEFESSNVYRVTLSLLNIIHVSLVDEGGVFDASSTVKIIDFGNIQEGDEKGADLRIVSNTPYEVKVSSSNNGKIMNSKGNTIEYQFKSNNSSYNLSNSANHAISIGNGNRTTSAGDRYNLKIKIIEAIDSKPAGLYQDVITITALAN